MESFFLEDGILLLEGQDDVVLLPRVLADLGLNPIDNVYGWGVGGATNMPIIARLLVELGFSKIAALLDNDKQKGTERAFEMLQELGEGVCVKKIPAADIRFKPAANSKAETKGLLDESRRKVLDEYRDDSATVLKQIQAFLSID